MPHVIAAPHTNKVKIFQRGAKKTSPQLKPCSVAPDAEYIRTHMVSTPNPAWSNVSLSMTAALDWKALRGKAAQAAGHSYAPYSRFSVGAAALVDDGRIVTGCNVENVSYGLGLCAECGLVCALHATGGGRLVALACVDANRSLVMPCGRCRQVLLEHGGPELLIDHPAGPRRLGDLLPDAFGSDGLA